MSVLMLDLGGVLRSTGPESAAVTNVLMSTVSCGVVLCNYGVFAAVGDHGDQFP